jgi:iron(III) transport system substrate-binding protein
MEGWRHWKQRVSLIAGLGVLAVAAGSCGSRAREVVVYTSVDQVFSEPVFQAFEHTSGIRARAVFDTEETKSTGVVNRLIAEGRNPQADVFWSNDPVRPFLLLKRGLLEPYVSPAAAGLPQAFRAADGAWTGVAARARVLLVNRSGLPGGPRPRGIRDLADPRWKGKVAIANPLFGTTTMHVAALSVVWGEQATRAFLESLKANDVRIASSNGEVKRLVVSGEVAFGLTDTDDANEALKEGATVEVVYPDEDDLGTLVMPTSVALIRGGPHADEARRLVDFLLSIETEKRLAAEAAHMPLRPGVPTPPGVRRLDEVRAMRVDFSKVADEMERMQPWLRQWAGL